jgi:hypothetical protein
MNEAMPTRQCEPWCSGAEVAFGAEESGEWDEADLPNLMEHMMVFSVARLGDTGRRSPHRICAFGRGRQLTTMSHAGIHSCGNEATRQDNLASHDRYLP